MLYRKHSPELVIQIWIARRVFSVFEQRLTSILQDTVKSGKEVTEVFDWTRRCGGSAWAVDRNALSVCHGAPGSCRRYSHRNIHEGLPGGEYKFNDGLDAFDIVMRSPNSGIGVPN
nr:hypothetical protein [Flavimaricola sp.]